MARFDPHSYPDRLAFEANARRIRAAEIDRTIDAMASSLAAWHREIAGRVGRFAQSVATFSHRHSPL